MKSVVEVLAVLVSLATDLSTLPFPRHGLSATVDCREYVEAGDNGGGNGDDLFTCADSICCS